MRLSQPIRDAAAEWATANPQLFAFLRGITVRFFGANAGGGRLAATFTASGVVVRVTGTHADILTAKHNLTMPVDKTDADPITHFCGNIRAYLYNVAGQEILNSAITSVHIPANAAVADGGYDAVIVRVTDPAFRQHIQGLVAPGTPGEVFRSVAPTAQGWIVKPTTEEQARSVLTNGHPYRGVDTPDYEGFELVQLGYGKVQGDQYGFAHRVMPVAGLGQPQFMDRSHEGWQQLFTFAATDTNTGASGDSGGPVFAVSPAKSGPLQQAAPGQAQIPLRRAVAVVAIHSGGDYFTGPDDRPENAPTVNNAITWMSERLTMPA